ncbi:MAG: SEL1-like repeat protein [Parachlamydiaceae bacterium]|nr:MAG: SEL1-like repeat protein [Parachlamydiaceae bacterium]
MGVWYDVGCGVEHNAEKALEYFELAAAQGDEDAKVHVERLKRSLCIVD